MENFTLLSTGMTPEVAVLLRAALIAAVIFGLEALGSAKRKNGRQEVKHAKRVIPASQGTGRERLSKKRIVRA